MPHGSRTHGDRIFVVMEFEETCAAIDANNLRQLVHWHRQFHEKQIARGGPAVWVDKEALAELPEVERWIDHAVPGDTLVSRATHQWIFCVYDSRWKGPRGVADNGVVRDPKNDV